MIILFWGIWSGALFRLGLTQYSVLGTGILDQIGSFERRLRGTAQTPLALPYPFRTWPGSGTWDERDKREVHNFLYFGRCTPELFFGSGHIYAELERKNILGMGKHSFPSKLASFSNWLLISSPPHFFHRHTSKSLAAYCAHRTIDCCVSLLFYI